MIEGVILATGLEPIPEEYVQGMTLPCKLAFEDQFGNEIGAEAELSVDRSTRPRPRLVRPTSIYDLDGVGATSEPGVSRVSDPADELLKTRLRQRIPSSTAMYWRTLVSSAGSALE